MAQPAHVLLIFEVNTVQVEGEVAFGEGLEVAQAARDHHLDRLHQVLARLDIGRSD